MRNSSNSITNEQDYIAAVMELDELLKNKSTNKAAIKAINKEIERYEKEVIDSNIKQLFITHWN